MAPTITGPVTYAVEFPALTNKLRKPIVEKMRRDRINSCIEKLKSLLGQEFLQHPDSKQEKADILEMTVHFLRQQQQQIQSPCSTGADAGYSRCVQEVLHFLSRGDGQTQSHRRLLSQLQQRGQLQPDTQLCSSSSSSKDPTPACRPLWRPW
uniref:Transcription factor HES-5 n=1 Tax=Denticeps clupeoides TaxID=299321 RepID=A0AAY4DGU3_9TELE